MRRSNATHATPWLIAAVACVASAGCARGDGGPQASGPRAGDLSPGTLLSGVDTAGFARAMAPPQLSFPRDHGPHAGFRSEWWYLTGILRGRGTDGGQRRFGYQLTIFRQALAPVAAPRDSVWASRDLYMGHLALSEIDGAPAPRGARFHAAQRFSRDGLALAGARAIPFDVWVESWRISGPRSGADIFPMEVNAREPSGNTPSGGPDASIGIALVVGAGRGPILQGDRGLSVKGAGPGNASIYYSCTRLPTHGRVTIENRTFDVEGISWLDREWSTSALDPEVVGWDWLGAHLNDGRDLMLYRLRTRDGRTAGPSRATLIEVDGTTRVLGPDAFSLAPLGQWQSTDGRARYPAGFRLVIPSAALEVTILPMLADQELLLAVRYWEGAVAVAGSSVGGRAIAGEGYLELTGYSTAQNDRGQ